MNDYETRKQDKINRYRELAKKNNELSTQTLNKAREMAAVIPLGQPIHVGHYSEKGDRNYRNRIHDTYGRGFKLAEKAEYYKDKAATAESNSSISSDDPEATTKLKAKLDDAEQLQEKMRGFNKCLRKKDNNGMLALGFSQANIDELSKPDFCGRVGFANYQLTNNNANIRRMKQRLATLEKHKDDTNKEIKMGDITVIDNVEINRLQLVFPDKPTEEIRKKLKSRGFRWSPTEGAWQRQRSNGAIYAAREVIKSIQEATK